MADDKTDETIDVISTASSGEKVEDNEKENSSKVKTPIDPTEKLMIVFSCSVILVVIIFVVVLVTNGIKTAALRSVCEEIESRKNTGKSAGTSVQQPSVEDIMFCQSIKCKFDVLNCKVPCPFGFQVDSDGCATGCQCGGRGILQGDIAFDEADVPVMMDEFGLSNERQDFNIEGQDVGIPLWTRDKFEGEENHLTIAYNLDADLTEEQISSWKRAIGQLEKETCIRFKDRKHEELDYLFVTKTESPDCTSFIGRKGGQQKIVMGDCFSSRHVEHMLMHALGFQHEHARHDREAYIEIKLDNVMAEHKDKFNAVSKDRTEPYTTDFDKDSVTMFSGYAYSIAEDKPTIIDLETSQPLVVSDHGLFSENDVLDINGLYCKGIDPESAEMEIVEQETVLGNNTDEIMETMVRSAHQVQAFWTNWASWGKCDHTCGPRAIMSRYRKCKTEKGHTVAGMCRGGSVMTLPCKDIPCPMRSSLKPRWSKWSDWSECSETCGGGATFRSRECSRGKCRGDHYQYEMCNTMECRSSEFNRFDPWSDWSQCSVECGGGLRSRFRECKTISRKRSRECGGIVDDDGIQYQSEVCSDVQCPYGAIPDKWFDNSAISKAMEEPAWFLRSENQLPVSVCEPGLKTQWLFGDFNGDRRSDILCRNEEGDVKIVLAGRGNRLDKISWEGKLHNCILKSLHTGDFDGDGTTDVLCVAVDGVETDMILFPIRRGEPKDPVMIGNLCVDSNWKVYVVDANGDGKDDILCRDETVEPKKFSKIHLNIYEI
ncbi:uncharacterized protein LOC120328125 [Styela clava]